MFWVSNREFADHKMEMNRRWSDMAARLDRHDDAVKEHHAENRASIEKIETLLQRLMVMVIGGLALAGWELLLRQMFTGGGH